MKFLQRLWLIPEKKVIEQPKWEEPIEIKRFPQLHKQELTDNFEEKEAQEKEFLRRKEKRKIVWSGDLMDMFRWYDSLKKTIRKWKIEEVKEIPKKKHYRFDMDKVVEEQEKKMQAEAGKRFIENVDEVLNHK